MALERRARKLPDLREDMVTRDEVKEWCGTSKMFPKTKRDVEISRKVCDVD